MKKSSVLLAILFVVSSFQFVFAADLTPFTEKEIAKILFGSTNDQNKKLQVTLNTLGYTIADEGPGSDGNETNKFDQRLRQAIFNFQKENEISETGKFDLKTAQVMNKLITFYNSSLNDSGEESTDISDVYNSDLSDTYGDKASDMNKDYFGNGEEGAREYFGNGKKDATEYLNDAVGSYKDVDITGNAKNGVREDKFASGRREDNSLDTGKIASGTKQISSGNVFQDSIVKTILGNATVLFLQNFSGLVTGLKPVSSSQDSTDYEKYTRGVTISPTSQKKKYTEEEIQDSIKNVTGADGKVDMFKCMNDPICSNY